MSKALLSRIGRPSSPARLTSTERPGLRAQTDATLRDLALVFHLTQGVKSAILREHPDRTAAFGLA